MVSDGATGAITGVRPASKRLWRSEPLTPTISPTSPSSAPASGWAVRRPPSTPERSEEHTSELQSRYVISYAVFCLKKKKKKTNHFSYIAYPKKKKHTST